MRSAVRIFTSMRPSGDFTLKLVCADTWATTIMMIPTTTLHRIAKPFTDRASINLFNAAHFGMRRITKTNDDLFAGRLLFRRNGRPERTRGDAAVDQQSLSCDVPA